MLGTSIAIVMIIMLIIIDTSEIYYEFKDVLLLYQTLFKGKS